MARATLDLRENPRSRRSAGWLSRVLEREIPSLRDDVKRLLRGRHLGQGSARVGHGSARPNRQAPGTLGVGVYPEQQLGPQNLMWVGVVDLLVVGPECIELVEYKSGASAEWHSLQLQLYALLWWRDARRNPDGRTATSLTLSYPSGDQVTPGPTGPELENLECELERRRVAALEATQRRTPVASLDEEHCLSCDVRHLCDVYWDALLARREDAVGGFPFVDAGIELDHRVGPTSWVGTVVCGWGVERGTSVILPGLPFATEVDRGSLLRILSGRLGGLPGTGLRPSISTTPPSEVFVVV